MNRDGDENGSEVVGRMDGGGPARTDGGGPARTDGGGPALSDGGSAEADELRDGEWTGEDAVEVVLGDCLRDRGETIAVAESLTGGLIGSTITDVPGSSDYFDRSLVTYAYDAKRQELAVPREDLDAHGAVSAPVARAMAQGVRDRADTTWGVSATGIAGPGGGRKDKPVGLLYVGVAFAAPWGSGESYTRATRFELDGDRDAIKRQAATAALASVVRAIREHE